jgi:hypothetical protein
MGRDGKGQGGEQREFVQRGKHVVSPKRKSDGFLQLPSF